MLKLTLIKNYLKSNNNKKLIKYFLLTNGINKINICVIGIEIYFYILIFHLNHFNKLKSGLYAE